MAKSNGQTVIEMVETWLTGYMAFGDPSMALVLALWAMHTWVSERFDATPYLAITASTKQAGKTRLMSLLRLISRDGRMFGDMTPAAMFSLIEERDCKTSLFFDEAEKLSSASAGVLRSVMNTGYTQGQTVTRRRPGGLGTIDYRVFCPKAFALIGDVNDTLRDRSIVVTLQRGTPERDLLSSVAKGEAAALVEEMRRAFAVVPGEAWQPWLEGREREIWSPIFGCAGALGLDAATMARLTKAASLLVMAKTAPARRYTETVQDEGKALEDSYGERAIRDLLAVIEASGERSLFSAVAVERMNEIPTSGWAMWRGKGLDQIALAGLVSRFGVQTKTVWMGKGRKGRKSSMGYSLADVKASTPSGGVK